MKTSPFQISFLKKAILFSGVAMIAFAAPAKAGFEWKGPLEAPHAAAPAPEAPAGDDMAPVGMTPPPAMDAAPVAPVVQHPMPPSAPAAMSPATSMPAPQASETEMNGDVLTGFGSDIPLAIALQQVVPAGYQYSFANGVNPGTSVSWEGGKPWQQVLGDMLAKQGLGYQLQNNTVVVSTDMNDNGAAVAAPAQTGAAAPAPVWHAPSSTGASSAPPAMPADDLAPVSITSAQPAPAAPVAAPAPEAAPAAAPAPAAAAKEPVTIHREKKKSFFERMGWTKSDDSSKADAAESDNAAQHEGQTQVDQYKPRDTSNAPRQTSDDGVRMPADANYNTDGTQHMDAKPADAKSSDLTAPPASTTTENVAAAAAAEKTDAPQSLTSSAPAAPDTNAVASNDWAGKKGQTLREVLKAWSDKAGVELLWSIDYDYRLSSDAGFNGKYEDAVGGLLERFSSVRPQPYGQLHQSQSGPRVLEVKSYDLTR